MDEIVYFDPLPIKIIESIVKKFIKELNTKLAARKIKLKLTKEVVKYLAEKGFDPQLGARPMKRLIQKEIKDPLADEILFGKLKEGGKVTVSLLDGVVSFNFE